MLTIHKVVIISLKLFRYLLSKTLLFTNYDLWQFNFHWRLQLFMRLARMAKVYNLSWLLLGTLLWLQCLLNTFSTWSKWQIGFRELILIRKQILKVLGETWSFLKDSITYTHNFLLLLFLDLFWFRRNHRNYFVLTKITFNLSSSIKLIFKIFYLFFLFCWRFALRCLLFNLFP